MSRNRVLAVVLIAIACTAFATLYIVRASRRATANGRRDTGTSIDEAMLQELQHRPHALFRTTKLGAGYGHVVVANLEPADVRYQTSLECERVAVAAGTGLCLTADRGVLTTYWAVIFGPDYRPLHRLELSGIPSRTRLSPDGRLGAITVFAGGHSYSDMSFSTRTTIVDTQKGEIVGDLEHFTVSRDGQPFTNANFNYWGVTFARDSRTFYATLASGKQTYLIRADATTQQATVIRENVECPSLSPDNLRIAFKKRMNVGSRLIWRLAVLELESGSEHLVEGETRSVDDQVEWLDNNRIAYAVDDEAEGRGGTSIWAVDVSKGPSSVWADGAYSPAIVASVNP